MGWRVPNQALAPILQSQAIPLVSVGEKNGPFLIQAQQFLMGTGAIPGIPRQSLDAIPVSMKTAIGAAMVANRLIVRCGSQVRSGPTANAEILPACYSTSCGGNRSSGQSSHHIHLQPVSR